MGSPGAVNAEQNVVLFDGVCNLCNRLVRFIIKRDRRNIFRFASLQSTYGQVQLENFKLYSNPLQSIVLVQANHALQQSDAVLEIMRNLKGPWPLLYWLRIIPRFIRDGIYRWIANNRYSFFGRNGECWIPAQELKHRFIE
jgi:predicted DCC family thiol-disulfide oxidoreductase YuxK